MRLILILTLQFAFFSTSSAEELSEVEVFYRCYAHITGVRLKRSHPLLDSVKAKVISADEACLQVLGKGRIEVGKSTLKDKSEEAKRVFSAFTRLHSTFFAVQEIQDANANFKKVARDIYDEQGSALHYTRALFKSDDITDVLKGKRDYEGIRTEGRPTGAGYAFKAKVSDFTYREGFKKIPFTPTFTQVGDLIGLKASRAIDIPNIGGRTHDGDTNITNSFGGGVVGSKSYIKRSNSTANIRYDGANKMNRQWANVVLEDFLCKTLPAVRITDGQPYKKRDATAEFRKTDGCIRCHATMDQLAAGGRSILMSSLTRDNISITNPQLRYPTIRKPSKANAHIWPEKADSDYDLRPAKGALYFRSHTGDLVHKKFNNFAELGKAIEETDDYYACVAKKYYQHFTGIDVSLADVNDPFSTVILNEQDVLHRDRVIQLGEDLRKTKSTFKLIESIIKSGTYKDSAYAISGEI